MAISLFRGIAIPADHAERIRAGFIAHGIPDSQACSWKINFVDLRSRLPILFDKPDLNRQDTYPAECISPGVCACGDEMGAICYANRQFDERNHGLIIEFQAELADLRVDGVDFLYNCMFREPLNEMQREFAMTVFGSRIARYLDRAAQGSTDAYRFAMCDLAVQDEEVVSSHLGNTILLGGRHRTVFRSAFHVRLPIRPENILSITDASRVLPVPDMTIDQFRRLGSY